MHHLTTVSALFFFFFYLVTFCETSFTFCQSSFIISSALQSLGIKMNEFPRSRMQIPGIDGIDVAL